MIWPIVLSASLTVTGLVALLLSQPAAETRRVRERLRRFVAAGGATPAEAAAKGAERSPGRALLRSASRLFASREAAKKLQTDLERADILLKGSEFLALNALAALGLGAAGLAVTRGNPLAVVGGLAAGYLLPRLYLKQRQAQRQKAFNGQLAEALTVISNALKAGYSFLQAMEMVSREMLPPISVEFGRVLREVSLAVPTENALQNMARRVGSDDLDLVVTCVLIQRQVGGNLAEILDNISFTIRERIRIKGEIKTLTAQGRLSGVIVSLLPVALTALLFAINPKYMSVLFTDPRGRVMVALGTVSALIGAAMVKKITDVEV
ncbi:MAG TPA: secretion system protein [Firmicutes bacterium]|nr:secretion system protein [Bacillota bacterium]